MGSQGPKLARPVSLLNFPVSAATGGIFLGSIRAIPVKQDSTRQHFVISRTRILRVIAISPEPHRSSNDRRVNKKPTADHLTNTQRPGRLLANAEHVATLI